MLQSVELVIVALAFVAPQINSLTEEVYWLFEMSTRKMLSKIKNPMVKSVYLIFCLVKFSEILRIFKMMFLSLFKDVLILSLRTFFSLF